MSIFDVLKLRNWDSLRAFLYVLAPVVLIAFGADNLWLELAAAVLAPALMAVNSVEGFRTWFYSVLAAGQAVVIGLGLLDVAQVTPWVNVIAAVVGGTVAIPNVRAGK